MSGAIVGSCSCESTVSVDLGLAGLGAVPVGVPWSAFAGGSRAGNPASARTRSGMRDTSGIFARDPETMRRISDALRKLEEKHGYKIHVVVEPVMIGTSPQETAALLQQHWLPDGNGLVVVYEADTKQAGVSRSVDGGMAVEKAQVPAFEVVAILTRVLGGMDESLDSAAFLESLVNKLVEEFSAYFERREAPVSATRNLRMIFLITGALCLLGLAAMAVGLFVRNSDRKKKRVFHFPEVDVPERLGAPYGGGSVTSRRFRARADK